MKTAFNTLELLSAVANARYALELWEREARVCARGKVWTDGPMRRGQHEIATLFSIEKILRARIPPAATLTPDRVATPGLSQSTQAMPTGSETSPLGNGDVE